MGSAARAGQIQQPAHIDGEVDTMQCKFRSKADRHQVDRLQENFHSVSVIARIIIKGVSSMKVIGETLENGASADSSSE